MRVENFQANRVGEKNPYRTLFLWTSLILLVLILFLVYLLAIKPVMQGYVVKKQIEASDFIIGTILSQIQQQGYVQLSYLNQSVVLVPYDASAQPKK